MPPITYLQYCLKYQDNFPSDKKTAVNFFSCAIDTNAKFWAKTDEELLAINKCTIAAITILRAL